MFNSLTSFRQRLYAVISHRCAATLDLIDAVSSHHGVSRVTELSLSPFFRRKYNSITKVITGFSLSGKKQPIGDDPAKTSASQKNLLQLTGELCAQPLQRDFFCLAPT